MPLSEIPCANFVHFYEPKGDVSIICVEMRLFSQLNLSQSTVLVGSLSLL